MLDERSQRNGKIRVLVADDHKIFSQTLCLWLERQGFAVVASASTGREAIEATLDLDPDVVLLDIVMDDPDGLAALAVMNYLRPKTPVIVLTGHSRPSFEKRSLSLGASKFISKDDDPREIAKAIKDLASHGKREMLPLLMATEPPNVPSPMEEDTGSMPQATLTAQETRILSLLARGLGNQAIAEYLHISRNTVKTHIRNIFGKLGVTDRTNAVIWAMRQGLVR